jgi:hypothetical protein
MFHVPEFARLRHGPLASTTWNGNNGAFVFRSKIPGRDLWVIASDQKAWEHVSVHAANRTHKLFVPTWEEMCSIKDLFWDPEDVVMQLHPARSVWINNNPATLHLWRPIGQSIPTPPTVLVGIKALGELHQR